MCSETFETESRETQFDDNFQFRSNFIESESISTYRTYLERWPIYIKSIQIEINYNRNNRYGVCVRWDPVNCSFFRSYISLEELISPVGSYVSLSRAIKLICKFIAVSDRISISTNLKFPVQVCFLQKLIVLLNFRTRSQHTAS